MANIENISGFIDPKEWSDLDRLETVLSSLTDSMEVLSVQAQAAFKGLSNVASLKDMVTLTKQAADTNNQLLEKLKLIEVSVKTLNEQTLTFNLSTKERIALLKLQQAAEAAPADSIAKVRAEAALLRRELMLLDQEKQKGLATDIKAALLQKDNYIKSKVDQYTAQKINIGNYSGFMDDLARVRREMDALAATGQKDSTEFRTLTDSANTLTSALGGTRGQLTYVIQEMNTLAASGQMDSAEFQRLATLAAELKLEMAAVGIAVDKAAANSERGAETMEKFAETMKEIGRFAIGFFGIQAGMEFISGITEEFGKADEAARKLRNTLDNVGSADLFTKLTKQSEEFAEKFKYLDTYQVQDVFSQLITYGKLTESQINEALPVIIDFAAKTGKSLTESASVIIKALEGNSKGLKEFGINIKDAKDELGKAIPQGERFGFIMGQLKPRIEGAANAFGQSFSGGVAGIKKDFREAELAISDFFVKLSGIDQAQQKAAVSAKEEASQEQRLTDEYEALSKKVNQTSEDKERLSQITTQLGNIFGNSVLSINEETGAIELNIQATKELIKQKLLLANNRASEQAAIYNAAKEDEETIKKQIELDAKRYQSQFGNDKFAFQNVSGFKGFQGSGGGGIPGVAILLDIAKQNRLLDQAIDKKKEASAKLKELGFSEDDVDRLFKQSPLNPGKNIPITPDGKKPENSAVENEKALTNALFEQYELQVKGKAAEQKSIYDDELENYRVRKEALIAYNEFERRSAEAKLLNEYDQKRFESAHMEKKSADETNESFAQRKMIVEKELANYQLKLDAVILESKKNLKEELKKLDNQSVDYNLSITKQIDDDVASRKAEALKKENDLYAKGVVDKDRFEEDKLKIEEKYTMASLLMKKAYYEQLINESKDGDPDTKKYQLALQAINNDINSFSKKKTTSDNPALAAAGLSDKDWDTAKKVGDAIINLETEITKAVDRRYQQEIANLEHKKQLIQDTYDADVIAINGSFQSEQKKAEQIKALNAQKLLQEKQIDDEIRREKRKMAAADKAAAIAGAIEKGTVAVVEALSSAPPPYNFILAALVGAAVAYQVKTAISTPLPEYGDGVLDHPGGDAIVGERNKPEWIFEKGKAPYMVNRATRLPLSKHARVIPEDKLMQDSMMTPELMQQIGINTGLEYVLREEIAGLKDEITTLNETVKNKRETHFSWNNGELRKSVRSGNSRTGYINKNF